MAKQGNTATATPPSPSSAATTSSPTLSEFPSPGDAFHSREELSSIIKNNGKALGYIFKCSVTSEHRVTYYCSNKYHPPRCMAGFKAAFISKAQGWVVTEASEHNEGCTRLRQRVNGQNGIKVGGNTIDFIPKKTDPSVALKEYVKASKPPVSKNTAFISTATSPSHSHKTRTSITNHPDIHASSSNVAAVINIKPTHSDNNTNNNRRKRSYSTSTGTSAATYSSSSSPPSSIVDARRSSLNGWQWALKEVDENEATLQDCHDDEGDDNVTSCKKKSKSTQEKRKSNDSDLTGIKSNKRRKVGAGEAEGRDRSSSSSGSSSSSTTPSNNTTTTILDPEFHFPQASLEASINLHKVLTLRKRKRSSSYVKNSDLLLGKYLENNQKDQTLMTLPNNDGCGVGTGDGSGDGNGSGDGSGRRILANSILLEEDDEGRETAMAPEKKFMKLIRVQGPSGWLDA